MPKVKPEKKKELRDSAISALYYRGGFTRNQIAIALGISPSTVKRVLD